HAVRSRILSDGVGPRAVTRRSRGRPGCRFGQRGDQRAGRRPQRARQHGPESRAGAFGRRPTHPRRNGAARRPADRGPLSRGRVLTRLDATSADAHGWTTAGFYIAGQIGRSLLEAMKKPRRARFPGSGAAMIKQAEKSYAPREVERQVQEFWNRAKVYQKTVA